jgi:nucleotide-binding universal stress UspA family protein
VDRYLERFAERCAPEGVTCQVLRKVGLPSEQILTEAEDFDLTLLGQQTYFHFATQESPDETLDAVLRQSRRPVVAVPLKLPRSQTVVVAYDASPAAIRALEAYQRTAPLVGQTVYVVSVARNAGEAVRPAEEGARFLRFLGFRAEARPLPASGPTVELLLEQVRELGAGMLVLGAHGHSSIREAFFGSTTQTVLEKSEVVLFLHH